MTDRIAYNYLIFFPGIDYYREAFRDANHLDNADTVFLSPAESVLRRLACNRRFPDFVHRVLFRIYSGKLVRRFRKTVSQMADPDRPVCFILSRKFIRLRGKNMNGILREAFPGSKTVVLLTDLISINQRLEQIVLRQKDHPSADLICSFDPVEAEKYDIYFHNLPFPDCSGQDFPAGEIYDVFFFGRDKNRLKIIRRIYENLEGRGFRCCFRVAGVPRKEKGNAGSDLRLDSVQEIS